MIKINICGYEKEYDNSINSWIKEQFHNRKNADTIIWYIISIKTIGIKLKLPSSNAPSGVGRPRSTFNYREQSIIDIWENMELKKEENMYKLANFLNHLRDVIS